jgi:hypothetical protein
MYHPFNKWWWIAQYRYPYDLKITNVIVPLFKNANPHDVKNYRPISLICITDKVIERCVYKHVHDYLIDNHIITQPISALGCVSGWSGGLGMIWKRPCIILYVIFFFNCIICIICIWTIKYVYTRSKDWLALNQVNVNEQTVVSNEKFKLNMLVKLHVAQNKYYFHLIDCNLFSLWYNWKIAHLALKKITHSLN